MKRLDLYLYAEPSITDKQAEWAAQKYLNPGWKFVSIERADNEHLRYHVIVESVKDTLPKLKPYSKDIFKS
ncbi:MAG: hypothetical protein J6X34_03745 [Clostridia bacterium]|nr:hypothetical protein [Clostridia bacterium]